MERRVLLLLVALTLGCRKTPNPAPTADPVASASAPTPVASVIASASATPRPPLDRAPCLAFEREMTKKMGTYLDGGVVPSTLVGFCEPTQMGAWRITMPTKASLDAATASGAPLESLLYAFEAHYVVQHVDGSRVVRFEPLGTLSDYGTREIEKPVLFDFNGDGEPELYVEVRETGEEGHRALQNDLLTFDGSVIKSYAPGAKFAPVALEDVDHDGRPDLKILAKYDESLLSCGAGFPYDWPEPKFVAHSLADGTFDTTDAAAHAYAKSWCPAAPKKITSSYDALCARLWAKTPAEIAAARARVTSSCVQEDCELMIQNKPQPPKATEDCGRRVSWFDRAPPLNLP